MLAEHAQVEEVYSENGLTGYVLIAYHAVDSQGRVSTELLRLNITRNTAVINSFGEPICLCKIQKGMWIDSIFSAMMTRSIPPQSNAFLIIAKHEIRSFSQRATGRIAMVDLDHNFLYTGNPNDMNSQVRYAVPENTPVIDHAGNPASLHSLIPGQMVMIIHANFMTASIPPQTTAFYIQVL